MKTEVLVDEAIEELQSKINDTAIIACSGGIDSSVAAVLAHRAVGSLLHCVYVDTGFMRKNESSEVAEMFSEMGITLKVVNASKRFFSSLEGVTDPEEKRKIIGDQFIKSFDKISDDLGGYKFLGQGTLYPDIIESGISTGNSAHIIKSHHNVGGLPKDLKFELIEPLKDLFKDEVRAVGNKLGISRALINRHPFPGPGLGVRIIGEVTKERVSILQNADAIFIRVLNEMGEYENIWQAFAVLVPVKTVGVMGDQRTYENLIALRAVTSIDGMTADWYKMPSKVLSLVSSEIVNNVQGVNRVVYDITSKPPSTIELE